MTRESSNPFTLLRRKPRLRAVMPACTKRFGLPAVQGLWQAGEGRHGLLGPGCPPFAVAVATATEGGGGWKCDGRVPLEAPMERSGVCFGGFRSEACGVTMGFSPWGSTTFFYYLIPKLFSKHFFFDLESPFC